MSATFPMPVGGKLLALFRAPRPAPWTGHDIGGHAVRDESPQQYSTPSLSHLGSLTELTLGNGGSSLDGTGLVNQRGYGNDSKPWLPVGGATKKYGG